MLNRKEEIKFLRAEITRLKVRLNQLDSSAEPTSVVCGHDVALNHLRRLKEQHEFSGLCQLAGTHDGHGWYTTNVVPDRLRALLEGGGACRDFLSIFCLPGVWEALEAAYYNDSPKELNEAMDILEQNSLVSGGRLTLNGFFCYAVIGHLVYNIVKKLEIPKAVEIFQMVYELTGLQFGEHLPYSETEFRDLLAEHPNFPSLAEKGITVADLGKYLIQNNV